MRTYSPMNLRGMLTAGDIAQELQKVQTFLRNLSMGDKNPIVGPTAPGLIGNPLGDYFYLPGRAGGQLAHGDTNASGELIFSSTRSATKGKIYFGSALASAYHELNDRLGIKIATPLASLHVKGAAPSTTTIGVSAEWTSRAGTWVDAGGGTADLYLNIDEIRETINDGDYIQSPASTAIDTNSGSITFPLQTTVAPAANTGHAVYFRARLSSGTGTMYAVLYVGGSVIASRFGIPLTTSFNTIPFYLTDTEINTLVTANDYTNIRILFGVTGEKFSAAGISVRISAAWMEFNPIKNIIVPAADFTTANWFNEVGTSIIYNRINAGPDFTDNIFVTTNSASSVVVNMGNAATPPAGATVTVYARMKISVAAGKTCTPDLMQLGVIKATFATVTPTTSFVTYSRVLTAAEIASIDNWSQLRVGMFQAGAGTTLTLSAVWIEVDTGDAAASANDKTAIFQAASGQSSTLSEWQNSSDTSLVTITSAGRLTVESGGSFRHVPGAAASTLFLGNASGDASWGTINLLSAYHADTLTGSPVLGDLIVANSTPKWAKLAGNTTTTKKFLSQTGNGTISALPVWDTAPAELEALAFYGDGSDSDATITGITILQRDTYYNNLTINNGGILRPNGWRIFVKGTLNIIAGGLIDRNGNAGAAGGNAGLTGGAGGAAATGLTDDGSTALGGSGAGTAGRANTTPGAGSAVTVIPAGTVGEGGNGGGGGGGEGNVGGSVAIANTVGTNITVAKFRSLGITLAVNYLQLISGGTGGRGGSSGSGDGVTRGGGGGGGGAGGGVMGIWAKTITNAGTISAVGGAGGAGGATDDFSGAGGGGGGGGGGFIYIFTDSYTNTGTVSAAAGANGAFGTLGGFIGVPTAGAVATAGNVVKYNRLTGVFF